MIIPLSIVRFFQLAFSVIVLGLSISAVRWQVYGSAPAPSGYAAFAGAWATLTALVGIIAIFVSSLAGILMVGADLLAFIILLAGGITYAVRINGADCNQVQADSYANPVLNYLMNGGYYYDNEGGYTPGVTSFDELKSHCTTIKADTAFLFLGCITCLVAAVLVLLVRRRGGNRNAAV